MANEVKETWNYMKIYCKRIEGFMEEEHHEEYEYRKELMSLHENMKDDCERLDIEFNFSK